MGPAAGPRAPGRVGTGQDLRFPQLAPGGVLEPVVLEGARQEADSERGGTSGRRGSWIQASEL